MNSVNLIGRLVRDPEIRSTASDSRVAVLRLAVRRQRGGESDGAVFIDVVCFGRLAEIVAEHLRKGRRVSVEGRLDHRDWIGTNGEPRGRHEIVARRIGFLDRPSPRADVPDSGA
ncbi:MAG: single-stranded DNA-binding protein [Acidimicrobiales bacterium]